MDIKAEIVARLGDLPPEMQEKVLHFMNSFAARSPKGENGSVSRSFAGCLDPVSAREMARAIEGECERVDAADW